MADETSTEGIDANMDETGRPQSNGRGRRQSGVILDTLAVLHPNSMLDESALATALHVSKKTVRAMVRRFELPPALLFAGRATWRTGSILDWIHKQEEKAVREAERQADNFRRMST